MKHRVSLWQEKYNYMTSFFSFQKLLCNPQYRTRWVLLRFRRCRYARSRNSTIRDQSGKSDLEETPSSPINFHQSQQTFPLNKATRAQLKLTSSWRIAVRRRNVAIYNSTDDIKKRTIIYFINVLSQDEQYPTFPGNYLVAVFESIDLPVYPI